MIDFYKMIENLFTKLNDQFPVVIWRFFSHDLRTRKQIRGVAKVQLAPRH